MATVWTLGHSTRSGEQLAELLTGAGIEQLVDVRRFPTSRRCPWLARAPLAARLADAGIEYLHEPDLGGHRGEPRPDSPNRGLRRAGLRAYADHMGSAVCGAALDRLEARAATVPTAILCAEAEPGRCHRRLIADALLLRGHRVVHLLGAGQSRPHRLDRRARRGDGRVPVYPAAEEAQLDLFAG